MKKLFILAAAAVAVLAACTKTEVVDNTPDKAITFQVANYTNQTKADSHGHTSLIDEGFNSFKTYAWYTPASGTANQAFMAPATVEYDGTNKLWHATDRTYFWPKTGYVNFFSFAGSKLPTSVALDDTDSYKAKAKYEDQTIAIDDNILAADGAYGFSSNPSASHGLDNVSEGVPTLFRHMLAKVKFDICVDAKNVTDDKNKWEVTVNSAVVKYRNVGTLDVTYPATPSITFDADGHPTTAGTTDVFTAAWTPKNVANAELTKVASVTPSANGGEIGTAVPLIAESVVMPQVLATTGVTIELNYTITHTYDGSNAVVETVPISAKALTAFANAIDTWNRNTIYTYHIIIKPNGEILFDPAVEEWVEETTQPSYTIL
jgi:hypothetical protein